MRAIEMLAEVDEHHNLHVTLPATVLPGTIRLIVLAPDPEEDEAGSLWMNGISQEWDEELQDTRQDIYTLDDGEPVHAMR